MSSGTDSGDVSEFSDSSEHEHFQLRQKKEKLNNNTCSKLFLPDHLAAYMEERDLDRDITRTECGRDLIEKVFSNYVIVKNILSHMCWQEKLIAADVCPLWNSAINSLQNEELRPVDFSVNLGMGAMRRGIRLHKSSPFCTEPMAIFTFCNTVSACVCACTKNVYTLGCEEFILSPCSTACDKEYSILDIIYQETTAPRDCMYAMRAYSMSYFPLQQSVTMQNTIIKPPRSSETFFCGIYIPRIPGVEFRILNAITADSVRTYLIPEIKRLTASYIVKGVITCLTDNYLLYAEENNAESLEFLHSMQPNIPFAYGGCVVEDTVNKAQDMAGIVDSVNNGNEFISGNIMSLGLFIVPKGDNNSNTDNNSPRSSTAGTPKNNFEIYSHVIESVDWTKPVIHKTIQEFSKRVPRFEHSVALKFSCVGRQRRHDHEQSVFRSFFPNTPIAGVFGNGELGINHPTRAVRAPSNKRLREEQRYQKVHAYSTIFFYIGWGKITKEAERD